MRFLNYMKHKFRKAKKKMAQKKEKTVEPKIETSVTDLLVRIDIEKLYPPFRELLLMTVRNCRDKGSDYFVLSGLRDWKEQAELYAQGRMKSGKIVTNAKPGRSAHNYGVAGDGCKDAKKNRKGLQPDWKLEEYVVWAKEAEALGLEAGMSWKSFKEGPHIQLPVRKHGFGWSKLAKIYKNDGGLEAVWKELDKHAWKGECLECK